MALTLRSIHVLVIEIAVVLLAATGTWGLIHGDERLGIVSLAIGVLLVLYGAFFAGKARQAGMR